jgi:hypothetical protein
MSGYKIIRRDGMLYAVSPRSNPDDRPKKKLHTRLREASERQYQRTVKGTWFEKHGKTLAIGVASAAAIGIVAFVVYEVYVGLVNPAAGTPGCTALQAQLQTLLNQQATIAKAISSQQGGVTSAQQSAIVSLQSQQGVVLGQIQATCPSSPGSNLAKQLNTFVQQVLYYAAWAAAILIGIGTAAIAFFGLRWGWSKFKGPGNPPTSPDDVDLPGITNAGSAASIPADMVNGITVQRAASGTIDGQTAGDTIQAYATSDPVAAASAEQASYFSELAAATSDADMANAYYALASDYAEVAADDAASEAIAEDALAAL